MVSYLIASINLLIKLELLLILVVAFRRYYLLFNDVMYNLYDVTFQ